MNSLVIVPRNWGSALKFPEYLNSISRIGTLFLDPLGVTNKVKLTLAAVSDAVLYSIDFWQSSGHNSARFAKILDNPFVLPCSTLGT